MRAMTITSFGGPEVLKLADLPEPTPGPYDMVVEVHASSLNPVDTKVRQGAGIYSTLPLPLVPGYDVSGVVAGLGSKAEGFKVGDEVYASPNLRRHGAHAEYVAVDARSAAPKPRSLDHVQAAALPLVTLTAWESLHERAGLRRGETALIQAGAGGVGHVAVQLARHHGCRVITTASQPQSIELCRQLGANIVIDYKAEDVVARVLAETSNAGCPVVFDTVGGAVFEQSMDCVALNGRLVAIVFTKTDQVFDKLFRRNATLHLEFMGVPTFFEVEPAKQGRLLREAAKLADAGVLKPHIHEVIGLEDLPRAHAEQAQAHTRGKRVVRVR